MQFLYMDAPVKEAIVHGAKMSFFHIIKEELKLFIHLLGT